MKKQLLVFVHGYGVTDTSTYAGLPERLQQEAHKAGLDITVHNVFLARYVSFRDEVRMQDVARAVEAAVTAELKPLLAQFGRFAAITHSTGGPVLRSWWHRFYRDRECPMSHLIMLAPPNHGSALAQLGRSRLGRLSAWTQGIEPGQGVLNWLESGSPEAWELNCDWCEHGEDLMRAARVFPFVLTGQTIDRKFYDHLNSYTGESGSNGVVRVSSANMHCRLVRCVQHDQDLDRDGIQESRIVETIESPRVPLLVLEGRSHIGNRSGIMGAVRPENTDTASDETLSAIFSCLMISNENEWQRLADVFENITRTNQRQERLEPKQGLFGGGPWIHDCYSQLQLRLRDSEGYVPESFDFLLTGADHDPDRLPPGFLRDTQVNRHHAGYLTMQLNHDVLCGSSPVMDGDATLRAQLDGCSHFGFLLRPWPQDGFAFYRPTQLIGSAAYRDLLLRRNATTMLDMTITRHVAQGAFALSRGFSVGPFKSDPPGPAIPQ